MQSEVHEIDPVTVELQVQVPWDRVEKGLNAGYGKLQKSARVRGFRRGKVPRSVLQKMYGPQVQHEVITTLVEEGLLHAVTTHDLAVVAAPEMDELPRIEDGQPLAFKAKLEVRPKIGDISYEGLEVSRPAAVVEDAAIDAELEQLRERNAEIITPEEPRPAKAGDLLTIDYVVEIDAEAKPDMAAEGRVVELGSGRLLKEFEEGLTGKLPGDEVEIRVAYDEDVQNPELKNKRALFRVTIKELREKVLPALDDELAKDAGDYETLEELRAKTRERLQAAAEERSKSAVKEQLVEKLVEKNPIPVPPSLVTQQEAAMRKELQFFLQMTGQQGVVPELEEGLRERAENKVRAAILMGELARKEELSVADAEIDAKLQEIAQESGKHIAKVRVEYQGERREGLESRLLEDKLLDFLLGRATVTDAPPETPSEASSEA